MTVEVFVLGLLNGLTIGLLAVGFVLIYKANRFLNFAHAQMGTLGMTFLAKARLDWHWNWWIAFLGAVCVGALTGLFVDAFLVGRLRKRTNSPVSLLLFSVGIASILSALGGLPFLTPEDTAARYPQPFESSVMIGVLRLSGMEVLTGLLAPITVGVVAAFISYSSLGKQIRAAANNADAAKLCGISVTRVSAMTWALAGALAAMSAVLQGPQAQNFQSAAPSFGPYLLMLTMGAAAFGAFVSLPAALGGGLVLGMVGQIVRAETSSASMATLALFTVILATVLLRGRALSEVFSTAGAVADEKPPLRVPAELRASPLVRYQRVWLTIAVAAVAVIMPHLPYFSSPGRRFQISLVLLFGVLAVALTMLVGWGGQVSLGHFALVGIGAYLTGRLSERGWTLPAVIVVVGAICAAVIVVIGIPALRVRGLTLAVTTMGFAVVAGDWLFHEAWFAGTQQNNYIDPPALGRGLGTSGNPSMLRTYYVALLILVLTVAAATALRRAMPGRVMLAVRDNERAAAAFGLTPATVKLATLALSGFFAGVAGVIYADAWRLTSPQQFPAAASLTILALPVIGGMGSISGALAAAAVLHMSFFYMAPVSSFIFGERNVLFELLLAGVLQLSIQLFYPSGLAGMAQDWWQTYLNRRVRRLGPGIGGPDGGVPVGPPTPSTGPEPQLEELVSEIAADAADTLVRIDNPGPGGTEGRESNSPGAPDVPTDTPELPLLVSAIQVQFGQVRAVNGAEITVRPGEIVGLIGPNGAGKSTLMDVISGLTRPKSGSVRIFGAEVVDLPPDLRAAFGMSRGFQHATLFGGLTVTETLQVAVAKDYRSGLLAAAVLAPWARATEWRSRRYVEQLIKRFGLEPWSNSLTSELSTGMRRLVELVAQVATRPKLLLLDEPTGGVAQREAEVFGPLLHQIRDELDCSILIIEHDMPLLMGLCDRVYAMEMGRVIAEGTPEEIRNDPVVVASYLGTEEVAISRSGATSVSPQLTGSDR